AVLQATHQARAAGRGGAGLCPDRPGGRARRRPRGGAEPPYLAGYAAADDRPTNCAGSHRPTGGPPHPVAVASARPRAPGNPAPRHPPSPGRATTTGHSGAVRGSAVRSRRQAGPSHAAAVRIGGQYEHVRLLGLQTGNGTLHDLNDALVEEGDAACRTFAANRPHGQMQRLARCAERLEIVGAGACRNCVRHIGDRLRCLS
nr:hypothetical protein [Tanacetum cinerariifolium]